MEDETTQPKSAAILFLRLPRDKALADAGHIGQSDTGALGQAEWAGLLLQ